jgi:hypothetical protein
MMVGSKLCDLLWCWGHSVRFCAAVGRHGYVVFYSFGGDGIDRS